MAGSGSVTEWAWLGVAIVLAGDALGSNKSEVQFSY